MTFSDSDATRILQAIDARIERNTKSGASIEYTWGTVGALDAAGKTASAYIYGETSGAYMSEGFRVPDVMYLTIGDSIRVAMNYATGDRWVEEVNVPSSYKKIAIDAKNGKLLVGDGTDAPDVNLYRSAVNRLRTDDEFEIGRTLAADYGLIIRLGSDVGATFTIGGDGGIEWGPGGASARDTSLYRYAANTLATDDQFRINSNSGLTVYGSASTYLARFFYGVEASPRLQIGGSVNPGLIGWGDGTTVDTVLYRSAANVLRTDDALSVGGSVTLTTADLLSDNTFDFFTVGGAAQQIKAKSILLSTSFADPAPNANGIQFGADTNLYRSAAGTLRTDDSLIVGGTTYFGAAGAGQTADGTNISSGVIEMRSANPHIDFKISDIDYGARIIYDYNVVDGLEFTGATGGYIFDNSVERSGEAWTNVTYTNSWATYTGYAPVSYRKDAQGYVHLRGLMRDGTVGSAACTLPAGFRPEYTEIYIGRGSVSSSWVIANNGRVDITAAGAVTPHSTLCSNGYVSLEGIVFYATN